jgi:hypothetical protein
MMKPKPSFREDESGLRFVRLAAKVKFEVDSDAVLRCAKKRRYDQRTTLFNRVAHGTALESRVPIVGAEVIDPCTIDSLQFGTRLLRFADHEYMRFLGKLLAVWLAVAVGLSAVAVPSFAASQSACSQAAMVDDCDCGGATAALVCQQACSMCHSLSAVVPAVLPVKDLEFHRLRTDTSTPMTSLALPPETAPPRSSR